jgi:hypothetical protein
LIVNFQEDDDSEYSLILNEAKSSSIDSKINSNQSKYQPPSVQSHEENFEDDLLDDYLNEQPQLEGAKHDLVANPLHDESDLNWVFQSYSENEPIEGEEEIYNKGLHIDSKLLVEEEVAEKEIESLENSNSPHQLHSFGCTSATISQYPSKDTLGELSFEDLIQELDKMKSSCPNTPMETFPFVSNSTFESPRASPDHLLDGERDLGNSISSKINGAPSVPSRPPSSVAIIFENEQFNPIKASALMQKMQTRHNSSLSKGNRNLDNAIENGTLECVLLRLHEIEWP